MRIEQAGISLSSSYQSLVRDQSSERLRTWSGAQRPDFDNSTPAFSGSRDTQVSISSAARFALSLELSSNSASPAWANFAPDSAPGSTANTTGGSSAIKQASDAADNDPFLSLIKSMVEMLTGRQIKTFSPDALAAVTAAPQLKDPNGAAVNQQTQAPPQPAGYGVEYDRHTLHEEHEIASFAAEGFIKTSDGQEISFKLTIDMERHYVEETNVSIRAGDAVRKDPLVLNFGGTAAQLSDQRFRFDLNGDGELDNLPKLLQGTGYLALDRNGNGKIDTGRELFGPASSSGFAELALLDTDTNGWIDENDAAFNLLKLWTPGEDQTIESLRSRGVGALSLASLATPFELRGTNNSDLGGIKNTGFFLNDDGTSGTLQEIDLSV